MSSSLRGRLVLITGASSGIGRAAAALMIGAGARVIAAARNRERLESLAAECDGLVPIMANVANPASMDALAERVIAEQGIPDVVVANAGVGLDALFSETTDDALRTVFGVNLFGVFRTVRPFVPGMVERGSGRIVVVSSIVGKRGIPHYSAYSASKSALHGMADALRGELWGSGVTVGLLCPGSTRTDFHGNALSAGPRQNRVRPTSRSADTVARALVKMAAGRRRERIIGLEAKLMHLADLIAPGVIDRILARMLTRK